MNETIITKKGRFSLYESLLNWRHKDTAKSISWGILFFAVSLVINYFAGLYATKRASSPVTDIILDNIPAMDVDALFTYGIIAFFVLVTALLIYRPVNSPFVLKSMALFIIIRSFFIILTHIGPAPTIIETVSSTSLMSFFTFTGDLFFSAHTGLPFLLALIFWKDKSLRAIFLGFTIIMAVVVLLGHYHYSIDVFAAFFITYGIMEIAKRFFRKDFQSLR